MTAVRYVIAQTYLEAEFLAADFGFVRMEDAVGHLEDLRAPMRREPAVLDAEKYRIFPVEICVPV